MMSTQHRCMRAQAPLGRARSASSSASPSPSPISLLRSLPSCIRPLMLHHHHHHSPHRIGSSARAASSFETAGGGYSAASQQIVDAHQQAVVTTTTTTAAHTTSVSSHQVIATLSASTAAAPVSPLVMAAGATAALATIALAAKKILDTPSREYVAGADTVGNEYDAWTEEGVLEYYWGEHIHLGYYTDEERAAGYKKKDFKQAKFDFVDEMYKWGTQAIDSSKVKKVLDVGCGFGGTSRYLAKKLLPEHADVTAITLSPKQVERATQLAKEQGVHEKTNFQVMDALNMDFPDNSFDLVWACESGEHMPDKTKYVNEMIRVLKPGGRLIIATWCQRDNLEELKASGTSEEVMANAYENLVGFTDEEKERLDFLYREWAHPYFISYEEYARICERSGVVKDVTMADWAKETIDSWRHSIWVGVWDPWIVVFKGPKVWYKTIREIVTLERMHRAFDDGLLTYGMISCTKK